MVDRDSAKAHTPSVGSAARRKAGSRAKGTPSPAPPAADSDGLTAQQRRFCLEYLADKTLNAKQAAIRAGYSERTAESQASRLLRNVKVKAFVGARLQVTEKKLGVTIERIEEELAHSALFDPADILDPETGATLPVVKWPPHARRALAGFEEEALFETVVVGEGPRGGQQKERVQVGLVRKFKWHNKTEAQKLFLQRLGGLVEKSEVTVLDETGEVTDAEWEALAKLSHQVRDE